MTPEAAHQTLSANLIESIVLVRVGEFYETFNKDAVLLSALTGTILTKRNQVNRSGFMAGDLDTIEAKLRDSEIHVIVVERY